MKILRVIASINPAHGGPLEGIKQSGRIMAELGCTNEVLCVDAPDTPWAKDFPLMTHAVGPALNQWRYASAVVPWLKKNLHRYDAAMIHGLWQYPGYAAGMQLKRAGIPYFVFVHGGLAPWLKRQYPLKHLKKSMFWPWADFPLLRDAQAVFYTCEEERRDARKTFPFYRANEVVIPYGAAAPDGNALMQRTAFLQAYPGLNGKKIVLFVGRIQPVKGCDLLLEAFARIMGGDDSYHLAFAGPDPVGLVASLTRRAQELGIERQVTWLGMVGGDVKWGAYRAADVFVLPSHHENFGIVVAEALACGLPVLLTNRVNIWREVFADGAGLVAEDTREGIAELLQQWMALADGDKQRMQEAAAACFLSRYEIGAAVRAQLDIVQTYVGYAGQGAA